MHRVFIVDDEEFVIKSLTGSIQWSTLGFEVTGKATNGREALESISNMDVDVVFSDVRMPGISGLELIKEVQKIKPNIIFIIISGYPEFTYVQKALNYGALGYCLKPFDETEINKLLTKAKGILNNRSKNTIDDFFSFAELIYNPEKKEILKAKLMARGLVCDRENGLFAISLNCSDYPEVKNFKHFISFMTGIQKYYMIVPAEFLIEQAYRSFFEGPDFKNVKGIGISEPFFSLERIQDAIEEANLLSYQYFISGEKICDYRIKENYKKGDEAINRFIVEYIKEKGPNKSIQTEIEKLSEINCINIKHAFGIYNFITYYNCSGDEQSQDTIYGFDSFTKLFKDFKSMYKYLADLLTDEKTSNIKESRNINFNQVLNYIEGKFNTDLTMQEISERFYINPSYISQLFRKEMGITFTDYVTKKRIELAKVLLKDEKRKMIDISQKCGYNDYFYFIRCFKKYAGTSPGQYRNALKGMN